MIIKIEIQNFGSIKSKETIKFNKDITAFIGKNESGKSTILRAIYKLNNGKIEDSDKNVQLKSQESLIEATFKLEKEDIIKINLEQKETKYAFYKFPEEYDNLYYTKKIVDNSNDVHYGLYFLEKGSKKPKYITCIFLDKIKSEILKLLKNIQNEKIKDFLKKIDTFKYDEIKDNISSLINIL